MVIMWVVLDFWLSGENLCYTPNTALNLEMVCQMPSWFQISVHVIVELQLFENFIVWVWQKGRCSPNHFQHSRAPWFEMSNCGNLCLEIHKAASNPTESCNLIVMASKRIAEKPGCQVAEEITIWMSSILPLCRRAQFVYTYGIMSAEDCDPILVCAIDMHYKNSYGWKLGWGICIVMWSEDYKM